MAAKTSTTQPLRHVCGDLVVKFYTLSAVVDGDTLTATGTTQILQVVITPNATAGAANDPAAAVSSGNVITFHSGGAWTGTVAVWSRVG